MKKNPKFKFGNMVQIKDKDTFFGERAGIIREYDYNEDGGFSYKVMFMTILSLDFNQSMREDFWFGEDEIKLVDIDIDALTQSVMDDLSKINVGGSDNGDGELN